MLFVYGIIRAIKGLLKKELGESKYKVINGDYTLEVKQVKSRPFAVAGIVRNIKLDSELLRELIQFQEKLHITVGRKRKKIAIGLHDLDKITSKKIVYTTVPLDYKFVPLGSNKEMSIKEIINETEQGREYGNISIFDGQSPIIMEDNGQVLSLPPVINAERTRITEETRNLFIDITGTSLDTVLSTLDIITTNLAEMGGEIESVKIIGIQGINSTPMLRHCTIETSVDYISKIIGVKMTDEEVLNYLKMARFDAEASNGKIKVVIPPYRIDIISEIDLTEEIAMTIGYKNLTPSTFKIHSLGKLEDKSRLSRLIRDLSIGAGFTEIFTFVLASDKILKGDFVKIINPVTIDYNSVRNSLIPTTLLFLKNNQHSRLPLLVFEVGEVVVKNENGDTGYKNELRACYAIMDSKVSFEDLQSRIHQILLNLGLRPVYRRAENEWFIKGRTAEIISDGKIIGVIGEVNPEILEQIGIEYPIVMSELYLEGLR